MNTFNIKDYIAQVAENVLSAQPDYDFQLTEVSGLGGLEGIISGQVAFDNFIATDSTGDGYVYQQPNGGYFMRRVATVFIMRKYQYMDMVAMREEVEKCRRYFNLIVAQMVADQPNLETKLIYLNTERIVIREFEPETSAHFTGLYFMLEFSQPYSLVAAPPVPPTPEPAYIKGRIVDGARTFSFLVNGNETITVDVDEQGWWKWLVDRTITKLNEAFLYKKNLVYLKIANLNTLTNISRMCGREGNVDIGTINLEVVDLSECNMSNVTAVNYAFCKCTALKSILLPNSLQPFGNELMGTFSQCKITTINNHFTIKAERLNDIYYNTLLLEYDLSNSINLNYLRNTFNGSQLYKLILPTIGSNFTFSGTPFGNKLEWVEAPHPIMANIPINSTSVLREQSILNLIAAAAANVTYTLHATVYAKCATGGEWHADIQAALDAKAAEGFTVTLISA